jgi:hypothetical protein
MYTYVSGDYLMVLLPFMLIPLGLCVVTGAVTELVLRKKYALVNELGLRAKMSISALSLLFGILTAPLVLLSFEWVPKLVDGYAAMLALALSLVLVFILPIFITRKLVKSTSNLAKHIKGYLPLSIPFIVLFHYLLYYNFHWKIEAVRPDDIAFIHNNGRCIGFPFPSQGYFWQGNTGEFSINTTYLMLNLAFYFLCGFGFYYLLLRKVNLKSIPAKLFLILTYIVALLYFTVIFTRSFPDGEPQATWSIPFRVVGLFYKWDPLWIYF